MRFVVRKKTRRPTTRLKFVARGGERVSLAVDLAAPRGRRARAVALFMPGYGSLRDGDKARALAASFTARGLAWMAFDPRGHGASSGAMEGLTLARHLEDLEAAYAFARTLAPRVVGVGTSLGGLILAAHAARRPRAYAALVLIAPAFGFLERWRKVPRSRRPKTLTDAALRSAAPAATPRIAPRLRAPCLIWHGQLDDAVPWIESARFAELAGAPVEVRLLNRGDHRLTRWRKRLAEESAEWAARGLTARAGAPPR